MIAGDLLRGAILLIEQHGGGMLLYLDQEGRGTGITAKMHAYGYQAECVDTIDADALLVCDEDGRRYADPRIFHAANADFPYFGSSAAGEFRICETGKHYPKPLNSYYEMKYKNLKMISFSRTLHSS